MDNRHETTCMYCFADTGGATKCPNCGGDASAVIPQDHLLPGTVLNGTWLVGRAVGQDATGIVYVAMHLEKRTKARIREYFPKGSAQRMPDGSIQILPGEGESYAQGLQELKETINGENDTERRHPHFDANNTLYVVQLRKKKAAAVPHEEEAEPGLLKKQIFLFAGVIGVLVLGILIAVQALGRNATRNLGNDLLNTLPPITMTTTLPPAEPTLTPTQALSTEPTTQPTADLFGDLPTRIPLDWQGASGTGNNTKNDYYDAYDDIVDKATGKPQATTAAPEKGVHPESPKEDIKALQWRLIELGWLDAKEADGVYGQNTRYAVAYFQRHIIDQFGVNVKANGYADEITCSWLNSTKAPMNPEKTTTPAPTVAPTTQPTAEPSNVITPDSPAEDILKMQNRLVEMGWLAAEQATGAYNTQTRKSVALFQQALKKLGIDVSATGYADSLTTSWLFEADAPRPTPIPEPTKAPTGFHYNIDRYYFTSVDGEMLKQHDLYETTPGTTTEKQLTIAPPPPTLEGYVFDETNKKNIVSHTFTDESSQYTFRFVYIHETTSATPTPQPTQEPTPEPVSFSYRLDEYYFTVVDGVRAEKPDHRVEGELRTTEQGSLSLEAPASSYEGYVFDSDSEHNRLSLQFTDPAETYVFRAIYLMDTYTPEPTQEPTPEPTAEPTPASTQEAGVINESSSEQRILSLQQRLVELGWMEDPTDATGAYNQQTIIAVTAFQDKLMSLYGTDIFDSIPFEQGYADEVTQMYLAAEDALTPDPTPEPTADPTEEPAPEPIPEDVTYSYEVRQYYFTAVDGQMNTAPDYTESSGVCTTTESSLTVNVPASMYEGYAFDASNEHNVLSWDFSVTDQVYGYKLVYIRQVTTPTPEPTQEPTPEPVSFSYRLDEYYFTVVDGVRAEKPDHKVEGELRTTEQESLSLEAPASSYEGYVFASDSEHNRLSLQFTDPAETYVFRAIYLMDTYTPEPTQEPTPEPVSFSYRLDEYYFTVVDGVRAEKPDHRVEGELRTTEQENLSLEAPASSYEGYVFASDSEHNRLSLQFTDPAETYVFRAIYLMDTYTPEPTQEPTPEPVEEPTPEPVEEPTPELKPEQVVSDDTVQALPGFFQEAYPDADAKKPAEIVTWLQKVLIKYGKANNISYFPDDYAPTGVYDIQTYDAVYRLQMESEDLVAILSDSAYGTVTPETFAKVVALYEILLAS